jgi:peroxiredoxin Q/BCP
MIRRRFPAALLAPLVAASLLVAADPAEKEEVMLKVGDPAPEFSLLADDDKTWNSADHYGEKIVVVYFYPADMTGGCTKQACGFRDDLTNLKEQGIEVVGVSGDSVRNHQLFKKAHNLNFTLLADEDGEVADKFGVPYTKGEKTVEAVIDGQKELLVRTVTTGRWTFVVDKDKKIALIHDLKSDASDPAGDAQAILAFVKKLESGT